MVVYKVTKDVPERSKHVESEMRFLASKMASKISQMISKKKEKKDMKYLANKISNKLSLIMLKKNTSQIKQLGSVIIKTKKEDKKLNFQSDLKKRARMPMDSNIKKKFENSQFLRKSTIRFKKNEMRKPSYTEINSDLIIREETYKKAETFEEKFLKDIIEVKDSNHQSKDEEPKDLYSTTESFTFYNRFLTKYSFKKSHAY